MPAGSFNGSLANSLDQLPKFVPCLLGARYSQPNPGPLFVEVKSYKLLPVGAALSVVTPLNVILPAQQCCTLQDHHAGAAPHPASKQRHNS